MARYVCVGGLAGECKFSALGDARAFADAEEGFFLCVGEDRSGCVFGVVSWTCACCRKELKIGVIFYVQNRDPTL